MWYFILSFVVAVYVIVGMVWVYRNRDVFNFVKSLGLPKWSIKYAAVILTVYGVVSWPKRFLDDFIIGREVSSQWKEIMEMASEAHRLMKRSTQLMQQAADTGDQNKFRESMEETSKSLELYKRASFESDRLTKQYGKEKVEALRSISAKGADLRDGLNRLKEDD